MDTAPAAYTAPASPLLLWSAGDGPVTEPCLIDGMPDSDYHADPVLGRSISNSGVKDILDAPARFRWNRDNPRPPKAAYDVGHAAHGEVLGTGTPVHVRKHDGRSNAGKDELKEARAAGLVPVTADEWAAVQAMAAALRAHPRAGRLFRPGEGIAERVGVWLDEEFGIWRRMKVDWTTRLSDGRLAFVDYKTTTSAHPGALPAWMWKFGYHLQDPFYTDGGEILYGEPVTFLFVFQEKDPPHFVTVAELHPDDRQWGRLRIRKALDTYARCLASDTWPDYADDIVTVELPVYARRDLEAAWAAGALRVVDTEEA